MKSDTMPLCNIHSIRQSVELPMITKFFGCLLIAMLATGCQLGSINRAHFVPSPELIKQPAPHGDSSLPENFSSNESLSSNEYSQSNSSNLMDEKNLVRKIPVAPQTSTAVGGSPVSLANQPPTLSTMSQDDQGRSFNGSSSNGGFVQQAAYQYPELSAQGSTVPSFGLPSPNIGAPDQYNPLQFPQNYADLDIILQETQTGRFQIGGAYNSDNGLVGQFIIDERNFDIRRFPRSTQDIMDQTAFRGGGQGFRMELVPGNIVQRYLVSWSEPYLFNTDWSFSASGYYFDRIFFDWSERRIGGRIGLGRRLNQDISITTGLRMENVSVRNPRLNTSPTLNNALGRNELYIGSVGLIRDTRDNQFMATAGDFFSATFSLGFGEVTFPRGELEYRRYRLLYERPDGSGRHTLTMGTRLGISGDNTPVYENFFAGGFSSLRGFEFRGVGPMEGGIRVGGPFEWINTAEYMFPVTADDMVKGVLFVDFGTVEDSMKLRSDSFRVAPGFGFRVHMPAFGPAPLAFDFGFPTSLAPGDERRTFSFFVGAQR